MVALARVLGLSAVHRAAGNRLFARVTQSKEYAEPEWYVDLWLTVVWVAYFLVFVGTLAKRREPQGADAGAMQDRVHPTNAYFETYPSGDEYDRAAITHVMACNSHFPGLLLTP